MSFWLTSRLRHRKNADNVIVPNIKGRIPMIEQISGEDFRKRRKALGMTQSELGRELGVTRQYIGMIENEILVPKMVSLAFLKLENLYRAAA